MSKTNNACRGSTGQLSRFGFLARYRQLATAFVLVTCNMYNRCTTICVGSGETVNCVVLCTWYNYNTTLLYQNSERQEYLYAYVQVLGVLHMHTVVRTTRLRLPVEFVVGY